MRGSVRVDADGKRTIVEVQASLLPVAVLAVFIGSIIAVAGGTTTLLVIWGAGAVVGNVWWIYRGLRSVASGALRL